MIDAAPEVAQSLCTDSDSRSTSCYRDFIEIPPFVFPEQPYGVIVEILPGLMDPGETYAFDDVGTVLGNTLGSNPGTDDRIAWAHPAGTWPSLPDQFSVIMATGGYVGPDGITRDYPASLLFYWPNLWVSLSARQRLSRFVLPSLQRRRAHRLRHFALSL